jgi:serine/threonine protein kinase
MNQLHHPTSEEIELFVLGAREEIDFADIEAHLDRCERCAGLLEKHARTELLMRELADHTAFCTGCDRTTNDDRCGHCGAALSPGGYYVHRIIVQTPHGRIYLAENEHGERIALKELVFTQVPSLSKLEQFESEGRILQQLDHARIPRCYGGFTEGEGVHTRLYLAQDYVEGESLSALMGRRRFAEDEVRSIAARVLEILVYLQSLSPQVFHRDIKPSNLIMRPDGEIVLVDFGSARDHGPTTGGTLAGTFGYMPLEQMVGVVDATSDLYALGATLSHLLTRIPPWRLLDSGLNTSKMVISAELRRFLERLTAQKKEDRFQSAADALETLRRLSSPPGRGGRRRWRIPVAAGVIACAVAGGFATSRYYKNDREYSFEPTFDLPMGPMRPTPARLPTPPRRPMRPERPDPPTQSFPEEPVVWQEIKSVGMSRTFINEKGQKFALPQGTFIPENVKIVPFVEPVRPVKPVEPVEPQDRESVRRRERDKIANKTSQLLQDGRRAMDKGDVSVAEIYFKDCLVLRPKDIACNYQLASLYVNAGKKDEARKYFEAALKELEPRDSTAELIRQRIGELSQP